VGGLWLSPAPSFVLLLEAAGHRGPINPETKSKETYDIMSDRGGGAIVVGRLVPFFFYIRLLLALRRPLCSGACLRACFGVPKSSAPVMTGLQSWCGGGLSMEACPWRPSARLGGRRAPVIDLCLIDLLSWLHYDQWITLSLPACPHPVRG
jgi:hypothetical protein